MAELLVSAEDSQLDAVIYFIGEQLHLGTCSAESKQKIELSAEEVFINICHYAYGLEGGEVLVKAGYEMDGASFFLTFTDSGKKYNPLQKQDPDITVPAKDRKVGGLGIFFVKKLMDEVSYEYRDSHNILCMKKKVS